MKPLEIKEKMAFLVNKWKDNVPEKNDNKWWYYRADQSLYVKLRSMLPKNDAKT